MSKNLGNCRYHMVGIYHSHVASPAYPSPRDVKLAFYPDVCYVIISLENKDYPQVRTFKIEEGDILEQDIKTGD